MKLHYSTKLSINRGERNMRKFLVYDTETTGLNKTFSQILRFAGIFTSDQFEEMQPSSVSIKLRSDVIPELGALLTNELSLKELSEGFSYYHAMSVIHFMMNQPNTISVGYNSLNFDDKFLRFGFFQNLFSPYTHQHANGCGRIDLYPMLKYFAQKQPDCIVWPKKSNGTVSFKLEDINQANQFFSGRSHDAMTDARITLALAKRLYHYRETWDEFLALAQKKSDEKKKNRKEIKTVACDAYGQLYQLPFPTSDEKKLFDRFRGTDWDEKYRIAEKFEHPAYQELAMRIIGENYVGFLPEEKRKKYQEYVKRVFSKDPAHVRVDCFGEKAPGVIEALQEIEIARQKPLSEKQKEIVNGYESWLNDRMEVIHATRKNPLIPTLFKPAKKIPDHGLGDFSSTRVMNL